MDAKTFSQIIRKFNPYHDNLGRFSSSGGAASFTYKPGASTAHSKAIEREKEKSTSEKGFKGMLYHGSPNTDIKEFDMSRAGQNTSSGEKLLFFTDSKQMADDFSYERLEGSSKFFQQRGKKGRVYEVDVEMKNPLDLRKLSDKDIDNILKLDQDGILTRENVKQYANSNHQLLKAGLNLTSDSLKELGYDGLIANTGKAGHNSLEYAVVDSKQAKIRKSVEDVDTMALLFSEVMKLNNKNISLVERWENDKNPFKILNGSEDVRKFNPYHDRLGRFTSGSGGNYASFTYAPGKSKAHDNAIAREKERMASVTTTKPENTKVSERGHITPKSYEESIDTVKQELGCDDKQAKKYIHSMLSYTAENYEAIRAYQSGKKNDYTKKFSKDANNIEEYIDKAPHWNGGTLYRGVGMDASVDVKKAFKPGTELDMQGTSSWSSDTNVAKNFARDRNMVIFQCDKISKATSISHISNNPGEKEILVSKDTKYVAKKVSKKGRYYYVYLEEVSDMAKSFNDISEPSFQITKADADKRLVFGWALVSATSDGKTIIDHQGDIVDQDDLEEGAYEYVLNFRDAGEEHIGTLRKKARMVESVVFTEEKLQAMGIPAGTVPYGWWIGFYVDDDETWEKIKNGTYKMFSIEGRAIREPVKEPVTKADSGTVAKSFSEILKFNPYHDRLGRFATGNGFMSSGYIGDPNKRAVTFSANPKTRAGAMAIARESDGKTGHEVIGRAYGFGTTKPAPGNKQPKPQKPKPQKPKADKPKEEKPQNSNFTPAKTKKAAAEYAVKELGFEKVSYGSKLDLDTVNHINKQVADIQSKYPEVKGAVQEIKVSSAKNMYAAIETTGSGRMALKVSSKLYGNGLEALEKQYKADCDIGFHPKGTTAKDIVWHEYGHVIGGIHAKKSVGVAANKTISPSDVSKMLDFVSNKRAGTWEREVFQKATGKIYGGNHPDTKSFASKISKYATKNAKELFAEAFAEFNGSKNPSPECIALMKAAGIFK